MAQFIPFRAVIPAPGSAAEVASPPYDVMSTAEARAMVHGQPKSLLHVTRAEVELPPETDPYAPEVYAKARANYQAMKAQGTLVTETQPSLYVYALEMNGRRQTGIAGCASVDEYDRGIIKKHEKTRREKEDDRTRHILTVGAQTGPVFLTYRDRAEIAEIIEIVTRQETPIIDFRANDGVVHTVWRIPQAATSQLQTEFAKVPCMYIADGHHRAASASRTCAEYRKRQPAATRGNGEFERFLAVTFPASELRILPYNRVVKEFAGHTPESFLQALPPTIQAVRTEQAAPDRPATFHMYLNGQWWALTWNGSLDSLAPADRLDVSLLQESILAPLLGIMDPRTDHRIDFVGGIRGTKELEKRVQCGEAAVAFSMYPTTVEQLMAIADAHQIMPPKSTWFEPKLRDGLLIHEI